MMAVSQKAPSHSSKNHAISPSQHAVQFIIGGANLLTDVVACGSLREADEREGPLTVIFGDPNQNLDVSTEKARMLTNDDVVNEHFFYDTLVSPRSRSKTSATDVHTRPLRPPFTNTIKPADSQVLHSGPYYLRDSAIYRIYRLYEDIHLAFMLGVTQDTARPGPTPRLYYDPPSDEYPLRGRRVAVKDVCRLAGTPTSASSRDYQAFTGIADETAEIILRLIKLGAVIVGKTKTTQFASGEHAGDWVDYSCPFNPRGDGYLDPDRSSTGSAAALAAYSWLDYTIGTDTLGSMVGPAASQGIFGIRPTFGIVDLVGIIPVSSRLDTAGVFSRHIHGLKHFGGHWYTKQRTLQPQRLLYAPEHFGDYPDDSGLKLEAFIRDVEKVIGQPRASFDVSASWDEKAGAPDNTSLADFLATTLAHIQLTGSYQNNLPFRTAFKEDKGREPYANPMVRFKWDLGSRLTLEQFQAACAEQDSYRKFLREHVFNDDKTILILPAGNPEPQYRDIYDAPPEKSGYSLQGFGFLRDVYSFLGGLPQVVVPIGSLSRVSPVTGAHIEQPLSVSFFGPEGSDCALMAFIEKVLMESGRPMEVSVGPNVMG
ncbi:amidase signature domain-containing protein [Rhypophila decipiens]|uniref:Amidase signature domain-containing protein n=1 Tax=Rhypophila decipiens TaxID=261697 RepID=A0AAN6Y100_9PEZI|nr:amidase signature domain-containing protein [Rhypophila decipiens]